jgi:predicted ABC-type transport system involved in lysophospholipase L1 biosynthesis ATPase subunit
VQDMNTVDVTTTGLVLEVDGLSKAYQRRPVLQNVRFQVRRGERVAIARALIHRPRLILADEPTGNLDSKTGDAILSLVESLTQQYEMALLLVTHSLEATRICHRVLHMVDGRLEASADG